MPINAVEPESMATLIYVVCNDYGLLAAYSTAEAAVDSYIEYRAEGCNGEVYIDTAIVDA